MITLKAKELRTMVPNLEDLKKIKKNPVYIIVDNVLDTYNVGAIFRLADAAAAEKVFLCGQTDTPDDPKVGHKIQKASVGTWKWVPWQYAHSIKGAIAMINDQLTMNNKKRVILTRQL